MPDKKVIYLIFLAVLGLGSCRRPPRSDFRLIRLIDLLERGTSHPAPIFPGPWTRPIPSIFTSGAARLLDRGVLAEGTGLKRKLLLQGTDTNALVAPPGSSYAFDVDLPEDASLEFGAGIVRGENSEAVRKRLSSAGERVRFRVLLDMAGRSKTIFLESVEQPELIEGRGLKLVHGKIVLPVRGGERGSRSRPKGRTGRSPSGPIPSS